LRLTFVRVVLFFVEVGFNLFALVVGLDIVAFFCGAKKKE
jgi:hypothetical protein